MKQIEKVANKKALFVMLVNHVPRCDAHWNQFFHQIGLICCAYESIDAYSYISRYGDFWFHDDDDTTDYFTPWACMWGKNYCVHRIPWA